MLEGRRGAALGLAFFLGLGIYGIWMEGSSPKPPIKQRTEVYNRCKQPQHKSASVAAEQKADDRIADYTWWLTFFTAILGGASIFQAYFLIRADKTARISADAAKDSADAAQLGANVARETLIQTQRAAIIVVGTYNVGVTNAEQQAFGGVRLSNLFQKCRTNHCKASAHRDKARLVQSETPR
jgi:hypothetical protein